MSLLIFAVSAFIQNMAFTLTSRSRNSADLRYHFYASIGSNGIWLLTMVIGVADVMAYFSRGEWGMAVLYAAVYTFATALGSVFMMALNLGFIRLPILTPLFYEEGKRKVGSR